MNDTIEQQLAAVLAGTYKIERELGRGAMALVYLATDFRHGRKVAVKVLPPEMATAATAERFLREIRITAALQHPNILPLMDSGASDGLCWYVMPVVEGESLRKRLAEGPMSLREVAKIGIEVANALAHAHAREVIHRDIKPENIMLSGGQAIVMDFGLARAIGAGSARITAMGLPLGTPAYMSPEQIQGDDADSRSDIYGLGCVIYEMATGSPPFIGNLGQVMRMHVNDQVILPSQKRPGLPSPLDKLVVKALAKKPADRYQRAEDLVRDLEVLQAVATLEATAEAEAKTSEPKSAWRKLLDKLGGA